MTHYPNEQGEYKTKQVLLRFYPSDLARIDREAKQLNLTRTEYITRCTLNKSVEKKHVFKVNWRTYRIMGEMREQLKRLGNNINQIAKAFNSARLEGQHLPSNYPLPDELSTIQAYTDQTARELNQIRLLLIGRDKQ